MKNYIFTILFCLSVASYSATGTQTDWSGGAGVSGPVSSWSNSFSASESTEFAENPGSISLLHGKLTDAATEIEGSALLSLCTYPEDVDGDGDIDILGASFVDNRIVWWENQGEGASWQSHIVTTDLNGAFGAVCADVDNDGDNDIIGAAMNADVVLWWENTDGSATTWIEHSIDDSLDGAKGISAVDIDDDGQIDAVVAAKGADEIVWYRNNGSGSSWTLHSITTGFDCAMSVVPVDFDDDGDWDILSAAKLEGAVRWYENVDGSGNSWTEHSIGEDFYYARNACADDIDGDGDIDVLSAGGVSKSVGTVCWWENTNGMATSWAQHIIDDEFHGPFAVLQYDVNGDGDPDAVCGSLNQNVICYWENENDGLSWEPHVLANIYAPSIVSAADLTGDGNTEIFAASLYSFNITFWEVFGYQPEGSLFSSILDTGEDAEWVNLDWTSDTPEGTTLGVSMRSSWDSQDLGAWSDTVFTSPYDLSSLINDNDRFVQYCVVMQSDSWEITPALESLEISWNPLSTGSANEHETTLGITGGNPAGTSPVVVFTLNETQTATLTVYDLSGRSVFTTGEKRMPAGTSEFRINRLSDGIYFAELQSTNGRISNRFTVINQL